MRFFLNQTIAIKPKCFFFLMIDSPPPKYIYKLCVKTTLKYERNVFSDRGKKKRDVLKKGKRKRKRKREREREEIEKEEIKAEGRKSVM